MAVLAETAKGSLSSGELQARPLNGLETFIFRANRFRNITSRFPKRPFYCPDFRPQTAQAKEAYKIAQQRVIDAQGRFDFIEESRRGTFSGLDVRVSQTSIDNIRSVKSGQPLVFMMSHPNNGVGQGEWVPPKVIDLLSSELVDGDQRLFKILMSGSRGYTGWLRHISPLRSLMSIPGQIMVNVAEIGDFILAKSPRSTFSEVSQVV